MSRSIRRMTSPWSWSRLCGQCLARHTKASTSEPKLESASASCFAEEHSEDQEPQEEPASHHPEVPVFAPVHSELRHGVRAVPRIAVVAVVEAVGQLTDRLDDVVGAVRLPCQPRE